MARFTRFPGISTELLSIWWTRGVGPNSLAPTRGPVGVYNLKVFFGIFVQCSFNPAVSLRVPSQNARLSTMLEFFPPGAGAHTEKNRTYDYSP